MKCVNPRKLQNQSATGVSDAYLQVSCGKCYACLANRRRSWLFRLYNEHLSSLFSVFCTFTIDDDHNDGYVHKQDLQKFFKRLRHYEDFTYYAIGEYGTNTYRPHYHAVLFFKSMSDDKVVLDYYYLINSLWSKGFCAPAAVTYRRLNYVLHYHTRPKIVNNKPTFQLFSKGMGIDFLDDEMIDYLVRTKQTTIKDYNGNTYVIPRYYRKKLIEQGYELDPPTPRVYNSDNWRDRMEKAFGKKVYQISDNQKIKYMRDVMTIDNNKLNNYNKQDKLI